MGNQWSLLRMLMSECNIGVCEGYVLGMEVKLVQGKGSTGKKIGIELN